MARTPPADPRSSADQFLEIVSLGFLRFDPHAALALGWVLLGFPGVFLDLTRFEKVLTGFTELYRVF